MAVPDGSCLGKKEQRHRPRYVIYAGSAVMVLDSPTGSEVVSEAARGLEVVGGRVEGHGFWRMGWW